jgi:sugar lactone lactonase YvrE
MRDGLFRFDPASGERAAPGRAALRPGATERFNDGKADPQGRFWVGTIYEPRTPPRAALYRWAAGRLDRMAGDVTVSNGLAFSPDGARCTGPTPPPTASARWTSTAADGSLSRQRVFAEFPPQAAGQDLRGYGGRPDGAAVDAEGAYWVAMFEGQRLLRLAPDGQVLQEVPLPVRCPTMPCFGGPTCARSSSPPRAQPPAGRTGRAALGRLRAADACGRARPARQLCAPVMSQPRSPAPP